jgi:hypothetical protein
VADRAYVMNGSLKVFEEARSHVVPRVHVSDAQMYAGRELQQAEPPPSAQNPTHASASSSVEHISCPGPRVKGLHLGRTHPVFFYHVLGEKSCGNMAKDKLFHDLISNSNLHRIPWKK